MNAYARKTVALSVVTLVVASWAYWVHRQRRQRKRSKLLAAVGTTTMQRRMRGMLLGTAIGDAFGAGIEFQVPGRWSSTSQTPLSTLPSLLPLTRGQGYPCPTVLI